MTESSQNFEMVQGNDADIAIVVRDSADVIKDISNSTIKFSIAKTRDDVPIFTKVTPTQIELTDPANGVFTVHIDPADTTDLESRVYVFEAETTDQSGNIVAVTLGRILLYKSIITG